jgi:hypothetical protein
MILSFLLCVLILCGCGGPKTTNLSPRPTEETVKKIPDWFLQPPADAENLYAAASATSRDMQVALEKARTAAQADLAQQLSTRLGNLTRQFQEETGMEEDAELLTQFSAATKAVTDQTLVGARLDRRALLPEKGVYRAYVLLRLPLGAANRLLLERVRADQALYTRFRATRAFEELDKELKALAEKEEK